MSSKGGDGYNKLPRNKTEDNGLQEIKFVNCCNRVIHNMNKQYKLRGYRIRTRYDEYNLGFHYSFDGYLGSTRQFKVILGKKKREKSINDYYYAIIIHLGCVYTNIEDFIKSSIDNYINIIEYTNL